MVDYSELIRIKSNLKEKIENSMTSGSMSDKIEALIRETPVLSTRSITFRETVPSGHAYMLQENSPIKGTIKQITMHFPPGCNLYVKMRVMKSGVAFFPVFDYISLDNASPVTPCDEPIDLGEPIQVEILNEDDTYSHTPSCIVVIVG